VPRAWQCRPRNSNTGTKARRSPARSARVHRAAGREPGDFTRPRGDCVRRGGLEEGLANARAATSSTRWINPESGRRGCPSAVVLSLYAYALETIQRSRGLDPRFSEAGAPIDAILSGVFLLDALGLIAMFVVLADTGTQLQPR
jgi:hypothetical protein